MEFLRCSFVKKTSGSVAKCRLFSQASVKGASFFFLVMNIGVTRRAVLWLLVTHHAARTTAGKKATTQIHLDLKGKISGYISACQLGPRAYREATRNISFPPGLDVSPSDGLPPALNSQVPIYTPATVV